MTLTRAKVKEMRELRALGVSIEELAGKYGATTSAVRDAVRGNTWRKAHGPLELARPDKALEPREPRRRVPRRPRTDQADRLEFFRDFWGGKVNTENLNPAQTEWLREVEEWKAQRAKELSEPEKVTE